MIKDGQNIFDFCLEKYGTLENIFNVLEDNLMTFNSDLNGGIELNSNAFKKGDAVIKKYYSDNQLTPINYGNNSANYIALFVDRASTEKDESIKEGQNIFDICLQYFGDVTKIFDVIEQNDFDLNTYLNSGQNINVSNYKKGNEDLKDYYKRNTYIINNNTDYPTTGSQIDILLQWPEFIDPDIIILPNLIVI